MLLLLANAGNILNQLLALLSQTLDMCYPVCRQLAAEIRCRQRFSLRIVFLNMDSVMTRNKMRVAIESGKGMKVKVVKLC